MMCCKWVKKEEAEVEQRENLEEGQSTFNAVDVVVWCLLTKLSVSPLV